MPYEGRVIIGSDHGGFQLKSRIADDLKRNGYDVTDLGIFSDSPVDYPPIAEEVATRVVADDYRGILVCGTGIGMSIAANKVPGIRAARCVTREDAEMARRHNNANILTLGERTLDNTYIDPIDIVYIFLRTDFDGGRHERRVEEISVIEYGQRRR